jgi:hypothetical protein
LPATPARRAIRRRRAPDTRRRGLLSDVLIMMKESVAATCIYQGQILIDQGAVMGRSTAASCVECGAKFMVDEGGGASFHLLRCSDCGKVVEIPFENVGEARLRFIKGLEAPFSVATAEEYRWVREHYSGDPLGEKEYRVEVERIAGACECGGDHVFDVPPRCPRCASAEIKLDPDKLRVAYD